MQITDKVERHAVKVVQPQHWNTCQTYVNNTLVRTRRETAWFLSYDKGVYWYMNRQGTVYYTREPLPAKENKQ